MSKNQFTRPERNRNATINFVNLIMASTVTPSPSIIATVPYANNLASDKTPNNSASHLDPVCLTFIYTCNIFTTLSDIKTLIKLK